MVLTATVSMMAELVQDWSTPEGGKAKGILFGEVLKGIVWVLNLFLTYLIIATGLFADRGSRMIRPITPQDTLAILSVCESTRLFPPNEMAVLQKLLNDFHG